MPRIIEQLEKSRKSLLDLSTRNRLLSVPQNSKQAKVVEVIDEISNEVLRLLVKENKTLSFMPAPEKKKVENPEATNELFAEDDEMGELTQPEDEEINEHGIAKRHADNRLQTLLTSEGLQKRLLSLFYDAATFEEEQGVNILYLSLGMLKWFEDDNSNVERYAPLILVPVKLERSSAAEKFKIKWRGEEAAANLSLQAKMKAEFGLIIPDLREDDEVDFEGYMEIVSEAVSVKKRFKVEENKIVLGFFSFAKFLMYRDLDTANWPANDKLEKNSLIASLIQDGFMASQGMIDEDAHIDEHLTAERIFHVIDADSSQTLAIEEVRRGRNLVIQGPPGTGKSQTITNIIASAVADGKKVLFVAEKMAALEVVQRRMQNIGLGPLCLELHSSKSNKRTVLEELKKTRDLGRPKVHDGNAAVIKLDALRGKLNAHVFSLHAVHQPSGLTAYQVIGNSVRLKQDGIEARGIVLEKFHEWSSYDKKEKENLLADIEARIKEIGTPSQHIWRGVNRPQFLPNEFDKMCQQLIEIQECMELIMNDTTQCEESFPNQTLNLDSFNVAKIIANVVSMMPDADNSALSYSGWINDKQLLEEIVNKGIRFRELKEEVSSKVIELIWNADLVDCRQQIAQHGESFFRIFKSGYKKSISLVKSFLTMPLPKESSEIVKLLDDIITVQGIMKFLVEQNVAGKSAFGNLWKEQRTDWTKLLAIINWSATLPLNNLPTDFLVKCSKLKNVEEWKERSLRLTQRVPYFFDKIYKLFEGLNFDIPVAFDGKKTVEEIDRNKFSLQLSIWSEATESISKWINFKIQFDKLAPEGLEAFSSKLWDGSIVPDSVHRMFEKAYYDAMAEMVFTKIPELRNFDGEVHHADVVNFRENDNYRIEQARIELRTKHHNEMPRSEGGIGPLGILNGEFAKKRNHLPLRQLIKKTGLVIQALKPVFMMSPLSVAQFLEPGSLQFDLLVIDEASQIEPVDALGAIARTKQIVVVGDTRQLPPTRFFSRITGNEKDSDNEDEENSVATADVESILGLCLARGLPQRMLRWHYRSKHQSLIAVSNREFYENKLFIIPSPYDAASGMGLKFNYLPEGIYDSGNTAVNLIEAKAVAKAAIEHAKSNPQHSLGIGTFSMKQKQAIIDELEILRRKHPDTESFFAGHRDEPFFVKNLENIQGDERDVIYISVGYGKNQTGYMAMRFGPLSSEGGERRLNVLISRAKRRCEVFSSITADDIDLERGKGAGVAALKLFLKFAQTGKLDFGKVTEREPDSVFEEQVAAALRARGFDVKTQIGIAGFFVDVAIVDPKTPGRFILGIECDGMNYHSSRSARDRDRLRQAVLEDHGWNIHRIWCTDWFRRPKEQLDKTILAIENAQRNVASEEVISGNTKQSGEFEIVSDGETMRITVGEKEISTPYIEASFSVPSHFEPHEVADSEMANIVTNIIEVEGPIHESEVVARVRMLWNLARAGNRIQAKVKNGLNAAKRKGAIMERTGFYLNPNNEIKIRNRSAVISQGLKKPECLPPQEIRKATLILIEINYGASRTQISSEVARLFGFRAVSAQLKEVIEKEIQSMITDKSILESEGLLQIFTVA